MMSGILLVGPSRRTCEAIFAVADLLQLLRSSRTALLVFLGILCAIGGSHQILVQRPVRTLLFKLQPLLGNFRYTASEARWYSQETGIAPTA